MFFLLNQFRVVHASKTKRRFCLKRPLKFIKELPFVIELRVNFVEVFAQAVELLKNYVQPFVDPLQSSVEVPSLGDLNPHPPDELVISSKLSAIPV